MLKKKKKNDMQLAKNQNFNRKKYIKSTRKSIINRTYGPFGLMKITKDYQTVSLVHNQ